MTTPNHDRLVGRLPVDERRAMLDAIAHRSPNVLVEHSYLRKLEGAELTAGKVLAVAYNPGGGSTDVLVVQPFDPRYRAVAIPAAHVLRVSMATPTTLPAQGGEPQRHGYRRGEVLAGPPRTTTTTEERNHG